jgi:hypothetical protein
MMNTGDITAPLVAAVSRMHAVQAAWATQEPRAEAGPLIRADVARAVRASALLNRSADEYLMAFGIGGPNPCRSRPVMLPMWDVLTGSVTR